MSYRPYVYVQATMRLAYVAGALLLTGIYLAVIARAYVATQPTWTALVFVLPGLHIAQLLRNSVILIASRSERVELSRREPILAAVVRLAEMWIKLRYQSRRTDSVVKQVPGASPHLANANYESAPTEKAA